MPILAHGSGIDDILWFVVPVALVIGWLRIAERRARRRAEDGEQPETVESDTTA